MFRTSESLVTMSQCFANEVTKSKFLHCENRLLSHNGIVPLQELLLDLDQNILQSPSRTVWLTKIVILHLRYFSNAMTVRLWLICFLDILNLFCVWSCVWCLSMCYKARGRRGCGRSSKWHSRGETSRIGVRRQRRWQLGTATTSTCRGLLCCRISTISRN